MNFDVFEIAIAVFLVILLFGPFLKSAYDDYQNDQKEQSCISARGDWIKDRCVFK